jgi:1-acyl-sn-glycerol-3-phosphate acyltransferase
MGINKVDQKSIPYSILYFFVKIWHHVFFYKRVEVSNLDRVPKEGALIFTPNHQNALMDALALLFAVDRPLVFLARADMFRTKIIAEALYFLRILPVFRPRDGHGEVKKNQDTFDKTTEVLQKSYGLGIFPEGNHGDKHSLRALKKGFARIAYQTEEGNKYSMDIKIIPVGILYTNYQNCQSVLSVNYGQPFSLSPYYEDYKTNPAIAYNKASVALSRELKKYMVHIDLDKYYETIDFLQTAYPEQIIGQDYKNFNNRILSSRKAVEILKDFQENNAENFEELHKDTEHFLAKTKKLSYIQKLQLTKWKWGCLIIQSLLFILFSPILLVSHLVTLLPVGIDFFATSKIKDPQFQSSIKFGVSLVVFPLFFFIELLIFNLVYEYPWYYFLLLYFISIIVITQTAGWLRHLYARFKLFLLWAFHSKQFKELLSLHKKIENQILSFSKK